MASRSPDRRIKDIEELQRFLENCHELRRALAEFTDIEVQLTPYFNAIMRNISRKERAFRSAFSFEFFDCLANLDSYLDNFEIWAGDNYDKISPPQGGKPNQSAA